MEGSNKDAMVALKAQGVPCLALGCVGCQLNCCQSPMVVVNSKVCCCSVTIGGVALAAMATAFKAAKASGEETSVCTQMAAAAAAAAATDAVDNSQIEYHTSECYSQEQGCCEVIAKVLCCFTEAQFPPSSDIGLGCCGVLCCGGNKDDTAEAREPPLDAHYVRVPEEAPGQHGM